MKEIPSTCEQLIPVDGKLLGGGKDSIPEDNHHYSLMDASSWLENQISRRHHLLSACHAYQSMSLNRIYSLFEKLNESGFFSTLCDFESIESFQKCGSDLLVVTGAAAVGGIGMLLPMILRRLSLFVSEDDDLDASCNHSYDDESSVHGPLNEVHDRDGSSDDSNSPSFDVSCAYEDQVSVLREARLDYVITQVDISRMAKHASRHLDVKSILALPTVIYQSKGNEDDGGQIILSGEDLEDLENKGNLNKAKNKLQSSAITGGWSWQMVVPDEKNDEVNIQETSSLESETPTCVICLEKFRNGDMLRSLPCGHQFHVGCIDHWLLGTFSEDECFTSGCPTCKKRPTIETEEENIQDGTVPSWAFARLGDAMGKDSFCEM